MTKSEESFEVPWSSQLVTTSGIAVLASLGIALSGLGEGAGGGYGSNWRLLPMLVTWLCFGFVVRGYVIEGGVLYVRRLGWATTIPLDGLVAAYPDASVVSRSIRVIGNGGVFAFTGLYYCSSLGWYRAFLTDRVKAVVIKMPKHTYVVSPSDPARFCTALAALGPPRQQGEPASAGQV